MNLARAVLVLCFLFGPGSTAFPQHIRHYVFFSRDRDRIAEPSFLTTKVFEGAQLKYTWKELEPRKGEYNLSSIESDLQSLTTHGKRLFVQLQDVSFDTSIVNVPSYLLGGDEFGGGIAMQFETGAGGEIIPEGWVSRRWDPAVQVRMRLPSKHR